MKSFPSLLPPVARRLAHPRPAIILARAVGTGAVLATALFSAGQIQASGEDSPVGTSVARSASETVTSGGSYSAYTGSATRTVPDLVVPGGLGAYLLVFARTGTSRFDPTDTGGSRAFGPAGSWRHSYSWGCYVDSGTPGQSSVVYRVNYPGGKVIRFSFVLGPQQNYDPYMRGGTDVGERLEVVSGNSDLILHCNDGGRVYFQSQGNNKFLAVRIYDPFNQVTTLSYNAGTDPYPNRLKRVTEPGGRYLQFTWGSFGGETVIGRVDASNGQNVGYSTNQLQTLL